ncbi:magnesium-translocating P-type ATPase [Candidatus Falkowbacteria bacterium CG10_big_fil_rev_8_21_14_0_10_37_14]|uniref:Magnesium-transporting ATPase, P-type 1 n=1 Tax=Candidatus Falkowbacteria bacterium CG10_big_fil_rev_8_21_14_0_10_37_14 TaxID=1974561 RepID=A0A2M6WTN4_9BACT|nr:magnesium-translocating P-type ATPase [Candidatus Falkowbacteria bacterium]PIT96140.1 MAG: magnesium-translocating P-type ATPase [Candidatus Falkowbacteria bacterium CG10_big_fil_rev_8_21_14_0_10_37_14]
MAKKTKNLKVKKITLSDVSRKLQTVTVEDVLALTNSREDGLNQLEIRRAQVKYGYNELVHKEQLSLIRKFLKRFQSPLIVILFIIGTVSLFFGDVRSAVIVYTMIFLSAITDFIQEHKSDKIVEKLKEQVISKVEVIRDGKHTFIKAVNLVSGDIVCLSVGSMVPADMRLITTDDLFIDESSLTGEAFPVPKSSVALAKAMVEISAQENMVFAGTHVTSGYGRAVVTAIGSQTVFGRIAKDLQTPEEPTEFEKGVNRFGTLIVKVIIALIIGIFILNTGISGKPWLDSLMFSLALAVGLTPELLPMIMSITLARGSEQMSKQGVIVKRLNSIHDFGGMDVLCTDKTGTLTKNKIEMVKHVDLSGRDSDKILDYAHLNSYFQSGIANPLDEAVLRVKNQIELNHWIKIDETPFDFERRRLSVALEYENRFYLVSKGAPEEMLVACSHYEDRDGKRLLDRSWLTKANKLYKELSIDGFRVLAVAYKKVERKQEYTVNDEAKMTLLGFIAFLDPPKIGAKRAIDLLEAQGIEMKIITGDNDLVTRKICQQLDVVIKGVLTGIQIADLTDEELKLAVENNTIFARVSPEQKARVVRAIKANGHSVGYLGDGINDALPLHAADVGISVNNAADVAKEAADLILLTKDLKVLSLGVTEGRKTFGNTIKFILMGLSSNFGNMFSIAAASFVLPFLPMLPIQILLNNFLYDFSQVTIPLDEVDEEYIKEPKRWDFGLIKRFMIDFGLISSVFDITTFFILLQYFKANAALFQTAWFIESLATQALVIFIIRTRRLPFIQSRPSPWLLVTVLMVVVVATILPWTPLGAYFFFVKPSWPVMGAIGIIVFVYLCCVELAKRVIYKRYLKV